MRGHLAMEITLAHLGDYAPAVEHFERALLLYDPEVHRDDAFLYALNPGVAMRCFGAWALWFLGLPDQALNRIQEALSLARELSEPHGLAHALFFAAILHQLRREGRLAQEHAEAAIAVAREHGMVMYQALATMTRGWALIEQGWEEEAIGQMRQGLAAHQATGANLMCPHFLALLAEALAKTRESGEGLHVLKEALEIAVRTGERSYEAELYRLKGERLLTQSQNQSDAEDCFHQSIRIAQRQKAKSLELRAVRSAARLYQHQGKRKKARDILAPVYESFTEGFDTVDLREARALIAELA
jgi:predicted ATPase